MMKQEKSHRFFKFKCKYSMILFDGGSQSGNLKGKHGLQRLKEWVS